MRRVIFGMLAAFAVATVPARADDYDDAAAAYNKSDFAAALTLLLPLAEMGNLRAQYLLGGMYAAGVGVSQGLVKALRWYESGGGWREPNRTPLIGARYWVGVGLHPDFEQFRCLY